MLSTVESPVVVEVPEKDGSMWAAERVEEFHGAYSGFMEVEAVIKEKFHFGIHG